MTRRQWTDLATQLAKLRADIATHAARARTEASRAAHRERALGVDLAVRVTCRILRRQSPRFDGRRFMRAYTTAAK